jgi:hypothetical protein
VSRTPTTTAAPGWLLPAAAGVVAVGILLASISSVLAVAAGVVALVAIAADITLTVRRWSR